MTSCKACEAGRFAAAEGASGCEDCAAGRYAAKPGKHACALCRPGSFKRAAGAGACSLCRAGQYQDFAGKDACVSCTEHTYQENEGAQFCEECDYTCADGFVHSACGGGDAGQCDACPAEHFRASSSPSRVCFPYTTCNSTQFETTAATAGADRACMDHTTCRQQQWETKAAGTHEDRVCVDHTKCARTQWETRWAGTHHDRQCIGYNEKTDREAYGGAPPTKATECRYTRCHHDPTHTTDTSIVVTHVPHHNAKHAFLNRALNPHGAGLVGHDGEEPPELHHCMYFIESDTCKCFCHPTRTVMHLKADEHVRNAVRDRLLHRPCPTGANGKVCSGLGGCLREGASDPKCVCHYGSSGPACEQAAPFPDHALAPGGDVIVPAQAGP